MSLTSAEVTVVNQALDKIGSANMTYADQTTNEALKCITHYEQTRNEVLRSYDWNFAKSRTELVLIKTILLSSAPLTSAWSSDDVITGTTSGTTATILSKTTDSEYETAYLSGDFTDAEKITNATVYNVFSDGIQAVDENGSYVIWWETSSAEEVQCTTGYPSVSNSVPDYEWDYQYQLPSDFMRIVKVYENNIGDDPTLRYTIEGSRILSNYDTISLSYVKKVTDTTDFDALFTQLFICELALKLLPALQTPGSAAMWERLMKDREYVKQKAKMICSVDRNVGGYSSWNNAKYGSGLI